MLCRSSFLQWFIVCVRVCVLSIQFRKEDGRRRLLEDKIAEAEVFVC